MKVNGVEIFVDRIPGEGDMNFVLIHNAGGNHHFFNHQLETLKKYGDIILLDLPGHGNSKNIINDNSISNISTIVTQLCKNYQLKNICLIGLNNGANVVMNMLHSKDLEIKNSILIDPPIFMDKAFISEINTFIQKLETEDFNVFLSSLVDTLFLSSDQANKEIAKNAFMTVDKKTLQDTFRGLIDWDINSANILKDIKCPTLCILTDEHHCAYKKLNEAAPQFEISKVVCSKCWATLEVPEQINAMIERFLRIHS